MLEVRALLPWQGLDLEIGVGTGCFAALLGVKVGVDPSNAMLTSAMTKSIFSAQGIAEALPFKNYVL